MDVAKVEATLKGELSWLQKHERLVLAVIAGLVLWFAIGKIDTLIANHDRANLAQVTEVSKVQAEKNAATAVLALQQAAEYKALAEKTYAQNAQLAQANVVLSAALTKQQKVDASLPPTDLVNRWYTLVPEAKPTVIPTGVAVDLPGAVATVQALEEVPVLRTQIENERTQYGNVTGLLTASRGQVDTLNDQVTGLNLQITDDDKVCTAQIAAVKAEARKSKRRWFVAGFVAGFVSRQAIKTYLGF